MNWADYAIIAILALSVLVSLMRGFVREALSLAVWVAAFWAAFSFADPVSTGLTDWVEQPSARLMLAFAAIFLVVLGIGGLINFLVGRLVSKTGLSGTDRMVGMVFGGVRGVALVVLVVMLAGLTPLPRDSWWQESRLIPHFERMALWAGQFLPETLEAHIGYDIEVPGEDDPAGDDQGR